MNKSTPTYTEREKQISKIIKDVTLFDLEKVFAIRDLIALVEKGVREKTLSEVLEVIEGELSDLPPEEHLTDIGFSRKLTLKDLRAQILPLKPKGGATE